jgi:prolipoprotein diacylglyceryl transferase
VLASIPSPPDGVLHLGGITIHMYGLMLLLAIAAAIVLTGYRWKRLGGDWDLVLRVAVWGVAWGVVGARVYHDITSANEVPDVWWGPIAVWKGGLGIWGGVLFGTIAGAIVVRRAKQSVFLFMDAVAPGVLLAQGIGRWGNWWNQELYGSHTTLPWALEIHGKGPAHLYHPTFLYEFLWDVAMVIVLIWVGSRFRIRPPGLFALYVSVYTFGRMFEETLRVDPSHHLLGMRLNFWVALLVFLASTAFFIWWQFVREPGEPKTVRRRKAQPPRGPTMAIPKGRVRPRR